MEGKNDQSIVGHETKAPQKVKHEDEILQDPQQNFLSTTPVSAKQKLALEALDNSAEVNTNDAAYSSFSKSSKRWITFLVAMAGFFSPLSANIYFPALSYIAQDLHVSLELINLTITAYLICQCITPSITGDLADMVGRRPVYLLVLTVYFAANLGLSLQRTYAGLLILRMIQSAGASGTIALCLSVIHDIAAPHERGKYMGSAMTGPNAAPSIGPVLGGVLAQKAGWWWIFGFLSILSGLNLILIIIFLPETSRAIVGDGSIPAKGVNRTLFSYMSPRSRTITSETVLAKPKLRVPNPLTALKILFEKDVALIMYANGVFYLNYQCQQASLSTIFIRVYHLNTLEAGLCYLPYGIACTIASFLTGLIIDRDYQKTAAAAGFTINKTKGDDLSDFPIEKARLRSIWYFMGLSMACTVGYGWSVERRTNMAVPLILQFLCGITVTGTFNVLRTLTIDLHPHNPATASATINIIRGTFAAVGVSIIQILLDHIGVGWTFTLLAGLCGTASPLLWVELRRGMEWRQIRDKKTKDKLSLENRYIEVKN
ncbi:chloramphenicol resistance protein [Hyaloscypha variabilis]